jgi:hypothetical protein
VPSLRSLEFKLVRQLREPHSLDLKRRSLAFKLGRQQRVPNSLNHKLVTIESVSLGRFIPTEASEFVKSR